MGCDIHLIVQIRKNGKWECVPDAPEEFLQRDYCLFAFLAGVRDSFYIAAFSPKGLPDDMKRTEDMKFFWNDCTEALEKRYETDMIEKIRMPDGELTDIYDKRFAVRCSCMEEAEEYEYYRLESGKNGVSFTGYKPDSFGGKLISVPASFLLSFDEYMDQYHKSDYDGDKKSYGCWGVDFSCEDYHTHSWLTLQELLDADKSRYLSSSVKVPAAFYYNFVRLGGTLPEGMHAVEVKDFVSELCSYDAALSSIGYEPDVIIRWDDPDKKEKSPLEKGIAKLMETAGEHHAKPQDLRIVFAFDN